MKSSFLKIQGVKTHYVTYGASEKKMLFLHGWGGSTQSFEKIAPQIAEQANIETIVLDLPGFGESAPPSNESWQTHDYESWLEETMKELHITKAHFYGHSFGCRVIVRLLLKNPALADKVILTGAAGIKWPLTTRQKVAKFLSEKFGWIKKILPKKIARFILCRIFGARDWGEAGESLKPTLEKVLDEADFREELPKIQSQVLLLWGAHDTYTPLRSGKVFEEKLPHSRLEVFPDGRHGIHYTHTDQIVQSVCDFLLKS